MKTIILLLPIFCISACNNYHPSSDEEKQSYSLGVKFAKGLKRENSSINLNYLVQGIKDILSDKPIQLSETELKTLDLQLGERKLKAQKEKSKISKKSVQAFLDDYLKQEGVKATQSGLLFKVIRKGDRKIPSNSETYIVNYTGRLVDQTIFDSSIPRGRPSEFRLQNLIPGLREALERMSINQKVEVVIPPHLGYGESDNPLIPANSVLIFELELVGTKP
jgi:FKBP-type peptidyl-prolyl cis-trans isomerase FkpA